MHERTHPEKKRWNPFYDLFEKNAKPNARTLRTNFYGKLRDTLNVFGGTPEHFGLFDYLLILPLITQKVNEWINKKAIGDFYRDSKDRTSNNAGLALLAGLVSIL